MGTTPSTRTPTNMVNRTAALTSVSKLAAFLEASNVTLSSPSTSTGVNNSSSNGTSNGVSSTSSGSPSHGTSSLAAEERPPQQEVTTVLSDLGALFTLISKETTALSLAFAPPKESWDAVDGTIKKLHGILGKVLFCNSVLAGPGSTAPLLAKEWRSGTLEVFTALRDLLDTAHRSYAKGTSNTPIKSGQRKQILTATSLVWKTVERTDSLARTEHEAFVGSWKADLDMFDDALEEVEQLTQRDVKGKGRAVDEEDEGGTKAAAKGAASQQDSMADEDDGDYDNDDDFDFGDDNQDDDAPVAEEDMEVINAAYQLMKLVQALLRKVQQAASPTTNTFDPALPATLLYQLNEACRVLLPLQDDLASALYPPIDIEDAAENAKAYKEAALRIATLAGESQGESESESESQQRANSKKSASEGLADELANMSVQDGSSRPPSASSQSQAWFVACHTQIAKAAEGLLAKCR